MGHMLKSGFQCCPKILHTSKQVYRTTNLENWYDCGQPTVMFCDRLIYCN